METLRVKMLIRDDHTLLALAGEVDISNLHHVRWHLAAAVEAHPRLVVDLSALAFIDSNGLGLLREFRRQARARGGELELSAPSRRVRRTLAWAELTGELPVLDAG